MIVRRDAGAECGSRKPHQKAPEKSQSSNDELFDLMRRHSFPFSTEELMNGAVMTLEGC
jgi:hypothetical protein